MPKIIEEPKKVIAIYLKEKKIKKIKVYAARKNLGGPSAVIDKATDLLFEAQP